MSAEDRTYLEQLVAARTGLPAADAKTRVDQVMARVEAAKTQAKEAADTARKASATLALVGALSLVIGAFIAAASAALGGRLRDDEETLYLTGSLTSRRAHRAGRPKTFPPECVFSQRRFGSNAGMPDGQAKAAA